ncbi:MAG: PIN domain nuclease [Candidatus Omnitrophica bacterium]|nr:PIN domain nuclease [Candidatus Omnitrophota bacterium]
MTVRLIRLFFLILAMVCGYYIWFALLGFPRDNAIIGALIGLASAMVLMIVEASMKGIPLRNLSVAAFGLVFGFFMAWIITLILRLVPISPAYYSALQIIFTLVFCYLGMVIAMKGQDEFNVVIPYVRFSREDVREQLMVVDTSVIIDGRIAEICETGFLEGKLIIPRFVLQELQQVADSPDDSKRNRGRRGLDMLEKLKTNSHVEVIIHDEGLPEIKEVDAKLVRLSKILDCQIVTNDFNLNKVAKLENVKVLNINDLANAMRPVVFPGEVMYVNIKKEGKERNQGVAFLDDGTMIVVENARRLIGKHTNVTVSSVLQTSAGRMIFANLQEGFGQKKQDGNNKG